MKNSQFILLVDDHPLFRQGVISLIRQALPDSHIREAGNLARARDELSQYDFETVILDVSLPDGDGITFAGDILKMNPLTRVFILSMHRRSDMVFQARELGCRGYFLKEGDGSRLINALISDEPSFQTSDTFEDITNPAPGAEGYTDTIRSYAQLTRREKEVFLMLAKGNGYKEVAWELGISARTASVHRYNIFQKLGITTEIELHRLARDIGLIV